VAVLIVCEDLQLRQLLDGVVKKHDIVSCTFANIDSAVATLDSEDFVPSLAFVQYCGDQAALIDFVNRLHYNAQGKYVTTIAVMFDEQQVDECVGMVDDVLIVPVSETEVAYKIQAHMRVLRLVRQVLNERDNLASYKDNIRIEEEVISKIFSIQCQNHLIKLENLRYHISYHSMFHGDFLLTQKGPTGSVYIAIGKVFGVGLPAVIASVPLLSVFRAMSTKGLPVGSIAAELNRVLPNSMPDGMSVAASILELNHSADQLTVWSGGMCAGVITDAKGMVKRLIHSDHAALSVKDELEFCQDVAVYNMQQGEKIVLMTESLETATNYENVTFGRDRLMEIFDGSHPNTFSDILQAYSLFTEGAPQSGDITLVELVCEASEMPTFKSAKKQSVSIPWHLDVNLNTEELKSVSPVPQIVKILANAVGLDVHQDYISTILSELYNNALEHGLLGLSSQMKASEDGFMEYYMQRESRLAELTEGWINIAISFNRGKVSISVHDSGPGFDVEGIAQSKDENSFGRGMAIIRSICESLEYSERGSKVTVRYAVDH